MKEIVSHLIRFEIPHGRSDWKHLFYMGKLCEKLGRPCDEALGYYKQAVDMKSSAVDPVYRLHASRLKLLCEGDREEIKVLQVCYVYHFLPIVAILF